MGFLDKAKAAAEQAAAKAKEGVEDVQTKRELGQAYSELGKSAFDLIESGALTHPQLTVHAERIRTLKAKAAGAEPVGVATRPGGDESDEPVMPT